MVGTYPYVDPDNCKTYEQGESQIDKIITAGPHVFISLQGELPPQGEMKIGGQDGFLPYKPVVELIAASHTPWVLFCCLMGGGGQGDGGEGGKAGISETVWQAPIGHDCMHAGRGSVHQPAGAGHPPQEGVEDQGAG